MIRDTDSSRDSTNRHIAAQTTDRRRYSRRDVLRRGALTLSAAASLSGCQGIRSTLGLGPDPSERLGEYADALERFTDVGVAIDEGYLTSPGYVHDGDAGLGVPLVNPRLTELEPTAPQALFYELTPDGMFELAGVEWFVPAEEADEPPSLFGRQFDEPMKGETAVIPRHYGLHAWLFSDNPRGVFATHNPALDPPSFVEELDPAWDAVSEFVLGTAAEEVGYLNTEQCVERGDSIYGIPFVTSADGGLDVEEPPILLYRQTENWSYRLLGAEWFVPVEEVDEPPTLFGQQFHEAMDGHSPETDQPRHYGLHAWLYQANPAGLFAPFNTGLLC